MASDSQKNELRSWLAKNFVEAYLPSLQSLGVKVTSDLALITAEDLHSLKMPPIDVRRFLSSAFVDFPPAALPEGALQKTPPVPAKRGKRPRPAPPEDPDFDVTAATANASASATASANLRKKKRAGKSKGNSPTTTGGSVPSAKDKRRTASRARGTAHVLSDKSAKAVDGCGAGCVTFLQGLESELKAARRTEAEIATMERAREREKASAKADRRGSDEGEEDVGVSKMPKGQLVYNYTRLKDVVVRTCFDEGGNWRVHGGCAQKFLGVSCAWMGTAHSAAIVMRREPTAVMKVGKIREMLEKEKKRVVENIVLPEGCEVGAEKYFRGLKNEDDVSVRKETELVHGLAGRKSNASKGTQREAFREMVVANRVPSGKDGGEAVYFLDSKWKSLTSTESNSDAGVCSSFYLAFLSFLETKGLKPVSARSITRWMVSDFGAVKHENGQTEPSLEHTILFPHDE